MNKRRLKEIFERALVGTKMNYPTFDLSGTIAYEIMKKIKAYKNIKKYTDTFTCISEVSEKYKVPLRSEIKSFCKAHELDFYSEVLKLAAENWLKKGFEQSGNEVYEVALIYSNYLDKYPKISLKEKEKYAEDYKEYIQNDEMIYDVSNMIINDYITSLNPNKVFEFALKIEPKKSLYQFLTNIEGYKLMDSYSGKLLEGKIQLSTNRGFKNDKERPQQDAILSMVRKEDLFLNIIADGAGGYEAGEVVSREVVLKIKEWFENENEETFEDLDLVVELLKEKLNEINREINRQYENSYSTVVLALTIKDKTIILSVGDSTAYTYNHEKLVLLNDLDSFVKGYYEDARRNVRNNMITAAIGDINPLHPHINIIENNGQRIILSSDGVTDLVSDKTFISYFVNNSSSDKIVDDALNNPEIMYETSEEGITEVHHLVKTEDNISAIVVDLPNKKVKKL